MNNEVSIVIGSWGSYNECNERGLGSKWLDLSEFDSWEDIENELKKEGFELDGIDEELFIQDIEGINDNSVNWDYVHPKKLFETLQESGVLLDSYKYEIMCAYLEIRTFDDFTNLVQDYGNNWDHIISYYKGYDWEDYGREIFECNEYKIPEIIEQFIDFEAFGKYIGEYYAEETTYGIIETIR